MTVIIDGTSGITYPSNTTQNTAYQTRFKNRIINGDMRIDQRNSGASVTVNGNDIFTVDRFKGWANGGGVFTVQQSATVPAGFSNSVVLTVTTADSSVAAGDNYRWAQAIEGYNIADLNFGSANAQTVTVSFWVRSNLTGTYGGALYSVPANRSYVYSYSINAANTWEKKSITITGDTTGSWNSTNGNGVVVYFDLGSGSTYQNATGSWVSGEKFSTSGNANWIGTLSNNLYITGVQFEVGAVASAFEYVDYTTQLSMCQRYYQQYGQPSLHGVAASSSAASRCGMGLPVLMRTAPTGALSGTINVFDGAAVAAISSINAAYTTIASVEFDFNTAASLTTGRPVIMYQQGGTAVMTFSAEL